MNCACNEAYEIKFNKPLKTAVVIVLETSVLKQTVPTLNPGVVHACVTCTLQASE